MQTSIRDGLQASGRALSPGSAPGQDRGPPRLELPRVERQFGGSPASWDGPSSVRFSEFGRGPFSAGGLRAGSVSASTGDVTARATHFVPICWILAERLPVADSARQTTYSCGGFRDVSTTAGAIKAAPNVKRCTQSCQYYVIEGR